MTSLLAFLPGLESPIHWIILLVIGILLFGKRLPEMGRYLGKTIIEFKKGMKGLEDDVDGSGMSHMARQEPAAAIEPPRPPQRVTMNVPKFEDTPNNVTPPQA
ncbi:MAG TPA: twin-arginine translocase TatA/TatE family subunit [Gemmataceae bacterium]|jgi:sec-independent protein translocase protein TatA|nr:twin-arginine translocase TatA/TatE family subunit [Gemmataceae bacterium]